jgi:hypothetical protein
MYTKTFKIAILGSILTFNLQAAMAFEFGLNDLSILIPMPQINITNPADTSPIDILVGAQNIIPNDIYSKFKPICEHDKIEDNKQLFNHLKIVALRFDPCSGYKCKKQIRVIWQAIVNRKSEIKTFDCALHSFHDVNESSWLNIMKDLKLISDPSITKEPLQLHPTIKKEGLGGNYYSALKKIIKNNVQAINMTKITVARSPNDDPIWHFEIFERDNNNNWKQLDIPTLNVSPLTPFINTQNFKTAQYVNSSEFISRIKPTNEDHIELTRFLKNSTVFMNTETEESITNLIKQINQIDNPKLSHDQNSDCVKCHLTQSARTFIQSKRPLIIFDQISNSNYYLNPIFNLSNNTNTETDVNNVRSFGYDDFQLTPSISNRVINETAEAVTLANDWIKTVNLSE